jgi:hypothetical protein
MTLYSLFKQLFVDKQNTESSVGEHENLLLFLFWLLILATISAVIVFVIGLTMDASKIGYFGDFFGGILNPIFTFLTFFGLIITIVIQRMELRLSREEYQKTSISLNTQAIENTFFNILDLHHKIIDGLKFDPSIFPETEYEEKLRQHGFPPPDQKPVSYGRNVFDAIILEIRNRAISSPQRVREQYKYLQDQHNHVLGHYFRNFYQALKFIDSYPDDLLSEKDKEKYSGILRAQLSANELAILFLNCLDEMVDQGQFKNLLIRYKILEHAPIQLKDGIYYITSRELAIADLNSITQYLKEKPIVPTTGNNNRGAFGSNPVHLPGC